MKDFDDFAQLVDRTTDQDMARIFANVIEQMNLPKDANGNVSFSVEDPHALLDRCFQRAHDGASA